MTALCKTAEGKGFIELREIDIPVPGADEILIKVEAAGICGSDLHIYNWDTQVRMQPPVVMGHEFSGTIEEVGGSVTNWHLGDRVTAEPSYYVCEECAYCKSGFYNLCEERQVFGFWADGAFAEYIKVPAKRLHKLPDNISFEEGAMIEPFACCVHGVKELTGVDVEDFTVVSGPGAIGLLCLQVARASGARTAVIGTEADVKRLELARELGADYTFQIGKDDVLREIRDLSGGLGADVVIEASGAAPAVDMGFDMAKKRGKYLQIGLFGKPISTAFEKIAYKELQIFGSFAQKWSAWKCALKLLGNEKVRLKPLVSDALPLREWEKGFNKLLNKEGYKILLYPNS